MRTFWLLTCIGLGLSGAAPGPSPGPTEARPPGQPGFLPRVDSVFVAGFVADPGQASPVDGERLDREVVRLLRDSDTPAVYGGMEPCIRARQLAALRNLETVICGRLLMTSATHHEVQFMIVSPGGEFGPAELREESLERLAEQVHRRFLRESPPR